MAILLDLLYAAAALIASPYVLFRIACSPRWRAGLKERLGFVAPRQGARPCVWVHAASVGEVNAARPLVELMDRECPEWEVRISTTTNTGQSVARERFGAGRCVYFPLDFSPVVRRALRRLRPDAVVLVELEWWPNFLRQTARQDIPVVVVNGRMREESVGRYRALRFLFGPALNAQSRNLFCVQNETHGRRFERAGVPRNRIRVTGNMKYDAVPTHLEPERLEALRGALGLGRGERIWVAGCTWPGEETACLRAHRRLQAEAPSLRLILAPRHIERADEVEREVRRAGYACRRRSAGEKMGGPECVVLLDNVGELGYLYGLAEFAFVGKSLTAHGGHNVLEPAALGVTPAFGPYTDNFEDEVRLLMEADAAVRVTDEEDLVRALLRLVRDPLGCRERGRRGREAVLRRRGASRRHLEVLREILAESGRAAAGEDE